MMYWLHGYLLNQVLLTNVPTVADDFSKYGCFCWICLALPLCFFVSMGISSSLGCDIGSSTILNQLVRGSIIVMHIKLITVLSLPLRVYDPMRSTHNASQGVVMASFAGSYPYLWVLHLFTWQLWHFWCVIRLSFAGPFQYIERGSISSRHMFPGCWR